jgi:hypothetical protein
MFRCTADIPFGGESFVFPSGFRRAVPAPVSRGGEVAMFVDDQVWGIGSLILPQDSPDTCWAACAAGLKSVAAGRRLTESSILPHYYQQAFRDKVPLSLKDTRWCYSMMGFTETRVDVSSRRAVHDLIKSHAPFIVLSEAVTFAPSGAPTHLGFHVRVVYGMWGEVDSGSDDGFQIRIFDPAPPPTFRYQQGYLFSHFRFQMTFNASPLNWAGFRENEVGLAWYDCPTRTRRRHGARTR